MTCHLYNNKILKEINTNAQKLIKKVKKKIKYFLKFIIFIIIRAIVSAFRTEWLSGINPGPASRTIHHFHLHQQLFHPFHIKS